MSSRDNPFEEIERMFERMSREFDEMARAMDWGPGGVEGGSGAMGIDLADRGEEFVVTADVPGFEKEEIDLHISGDVLHVRAEHSEEREEGGEGETYLRSERSSRRLSESVRLPEPVVADEVTATCKNGVLTVHLPKQEPTTPETRIDIE